MKSIIVKTTDDFSRLKSDWEHLQIQDPDVSYYSTFRYVSDWWKSYSENPLYSLFIIQVFVPVELPTPVVFSVKAFDIPSKSSLKIRMLF